MRLAWPAPDPSPESCASAARTCEAIAVHCSADFFPSAFLSLTPFLLADTNGRRISERSIL